MISSHFQFNMLVLSSVNHCELSTIPNSNKNGHLWREFLRITVYICQISVSTHVQKNKWLFQEWPERQRKLWQFVDRFGKDAIELSKGAVEGVGIKVIDIASLSMLNTDLEKQGTFSAEVEAFRWKILEANSILFASPEYNFSVTAPLKNAMDWGSRPPNVWGGKVASIVSA